MNHIFAVTAILLHIVLSADSVRRSCTATETDSIALVQPQQSLEYILSDNGTKIDCGSNNATHTIQVSNPVTFSTQHRSFSHHTTAPQYNLNRMNTAQLRWYFAAHGYTEGDILSHPGLYLNQAYLALVKQLTQYSEFVKKYHDRYRAYNSFREWWEWFNLRYHYGMKEQFARLYQECEEQRRAQAALEQKQTKFRAQQQQRANAYCCTTIDAVQHNGEMAAVIPAHHQQARHTAYTQSKISTLDMVTRNYTIESNMVIFAQEYDITEADLATLCSNAYAHQLHTEFLEQLTEAHTISNYYALQSRNILIDAVGYGAAIGMEANRLEQPDTATAWADFGWKALEIIKGVGDGILLCTENTARCIQNPKSALKELIYALGNITGCCIRAIGTAAYWYELMEQGNALLVAQEMDDVANKIAACSALCTNTLSTMSTQDIVKNITHIALDMVITHKMLTLGSNLCSQLKPIVCDLIKNINKEEAFVEFILQSSKEFRNTGKISFLIEETKAKSVKNTFSCIEQQSSKNLVQLSESTAEKLWVSKGGLIYGPDKKFGTRINHILQHTKSNISKLNHTVFTMTGEELFDLIDFAWSKRRIALADDPGTYIIELEKIIGTQGEKAIKIVVIPGTNQLITAYPIKV